MRPLPCGYLSTDTVAARLADYHQQMATCTSRMHTTDVRGDWQLTLQLYQCVSVVKLQAHDAQGVAVYVVGAERDKVDIQFAASYNACDHAL